MRRLSTEAEDRGDQPSTDGGCALKESTDIMGSASESGPQRDVVYHAASAKTVKDRRKAQYMSMLPVFINALKRCRQGNAMTTEEVLGQALISIQEYVIGTNIEAQLMNSLGDVKTVSDCCKDMSADEANELFDVVNKTVKLARELVKDNSKSRNAGMQNGNVRESFKDRLKTFQKTIDGVKIKIAPMMGLGEGMKHADVDYCLRWIGGNNIMCMTLEECKSFPDSVGVILEELLAKSCQADVAAEQDGGASNVILARKLKFRTRVSSMLKSNTQQLEMLFTAKSTDWTFDDFKEGLGKFFAATLLGGRDAPPPS